MMENTDVPQALSWGRQDGTLLPVREGETDTERALAQGPSPVAVQRIKPPMCSRVYRGGNPVEGGEGGAAPMVCGGVGGASSLIGSSPPSARRLEPWSSPRGGGSQGTLAEGLLALPFPSPFWKRQRFPPGADVWGRKKGWGQFGESLLSPHSGLQMGTPFGVWLGHSRLPSLICILFQ